MGDPDFELGRLFCSDASFRGVVRQHAIVHKKAFKQLRNFGK